MAIKCPKCGHERGPGEQGPAWQCPGCGVAYAKVMNESVRVAVEPVREPSRPMPPAEPVIFPDEMAVHVVDIHMPFWSMVVFMVKWAVASIPAFLILLALVMLTYQVADSLTGRSKAEKTVAEQATKRETDRIKQAGAAKEVVVGMSAAEVHSAWGEPEERSVTVAGQTRIEVWRYPGQGNMSWRFVTLTDGVVTSTSGAP